MKQFVHLICVILFSYVAFFLWVYLTTTDRRPEVQSRKTRLVLETLGHVSDYYQSETGQSVHETDDLVMLSRIVEQDRVMQTLSVSQDWRLVRENLTQLKDSWGQPLFVKLIKNTAYVGSAGLDHQAGTDDDILALL